MRYGPSIERSMSVNEILARYPATIPVFNVFGIDACCGGAASLEDAASRDGADLASLLGALERAATDAPTPK